ncbi:ligand-binding protein SH3 [Paraburkholderia sp. DHOC27]|uniref:ligand-binding protein SH3 n=1 Tax=Paraburkholderia sp. DHOC27 TaxID=2303330 RepID=UPI000E3D2F79|nr:ligand-binding protein SH3 [Paraburkholderia sp. DHOC27]RFU47454.1 ligand-binding protein SH3 [Paraburkholderia sp. DHOC27]
MPIFLLFVSGLCSALASVLLRMASQYGAVHGDLADLVLSRPTMMRVGALGAYGIGFVLYAIALRRVELSVAYPLMVGTTVILLFLFSLMSGAGLSPRTVGGAALLMAGIWFLYSAKPVSA